VDNVEDAIDACDQDDFIKVKGLINKYKNRFRSRSTTAPSGESEVDFADYLPRPQKISASYGRLWRDTSPVFKRPHLKTLVEAFMADPEIAEAYRNAPAAKTLHHAFIGGLLEHVVSLFNSVT